MQINNIHPKKNKQAIYIVRFLSVCSEMTHFVMRKVMMTSNVVITSVECNMTTFITILRKSRVIGRIVESVHHFCNNRRIGRIVKSANDYLKNLRIGRIVESVHYFHNNPRKIVKALVINWRIVR